MRIATFLFALRHQSNCSFIPCERWVALAPPSRARATGSGYPRFSFPITHPFHNAAIYLHPAFVAHGGPPLRGRVPRPASEEALPKDQPPRSQEQKSRGTGTRPKTSTESEQSSHGHSRLLRLSASTEKAGGEQAQNRPDPAAAAAATSLGNSFTLATLKK